MEKGITIKIGDELILVFNQKTAAYTVTSAGQSAIFPEEAEIYLSRKDKKMLEMPVEIIINIKSE